MLKNYLINKLGDSQMKKWEKFSREEIEQFVKESSSYAQLAKKIGYDNAANNGSAYRAVHQMIDKLNLDTSHFKGQGWNKDNVDLAKYVYGKTLQRGQALRDLVILRGHKCENCNLKKWNGEKIPLEVHHINGDYLNSELTNLVLLCPNCHALTENYRNKNKRKEVDEETLVESLRTTPNIRQALIKVGLTGKGRNYDRCYDLIYKYNIIQLGEKEPKITEESIIKYKESKKCKKCGRPLSSSRYDICQSCIHEDQRSCEWPLREELKEKVYTTPFLQIGKEYNVSDQAIRNWCKYYSIPYKKKDIKKYTPEEWELI